MKTTIASFGLSVLIAFIPVMVVAAPALRSIMHLWRADAVRAHDILSGRAAFDEAAIRKVLETYASDAARMGAQVNGRTASAREFKRRLAVFQADARTAAGDLSRRSVLRADFNRLMSDCRSCHDVFN